MWLSLEIVSGDRMKTSKDLIKEAVRALFPLTKLPIPALEKYQLLSFLFLALKNDKFKESYKDLSNLELYEFAFNAVQDYLVSLNTIDRKTIEDICKSYKIFSSRDYFVKNEIILSNKGLTANTLIKDIITKLIATVIPYVKQDLSDILGGVYFVLIFEAKHDRKSGLVLTPKHIVELFCDLVDLKHNDIILDPCCGTGSLLLTGLKRLKELNPNATANNVVGCELRPDVATLAYSNFLIRDIGTPNIFIGDCREQLKHAKQLKPTVALINPPYTRNLPEQLEFTKLALDALEEGGRCVSIIQLTAVSSHHKKVMEAKEQLLASHTLKAVITMPLELFHPIQVKAVILVLEAHKPHDSNNTTYLAMLEDDGHIKRGLEGRVDAGNWSNIKKDYVDAYKNKQDIQKISCNVKLNATDEWLAHAHLPTDYSELTEEQLNKKLRAFYEFYPSYKD